MAEGIQFQPDENHDGLVEEMSRTNAVRAAALIQIQRSRGETIDTQWASSVAADIRAVQSEYEVHEGEIAFAILNQAGRDARGKI